MAQKKQAMTRISLKIGLPQMSTHIEAILSGQMQYPSTQTDWKKDTLPPRSTALTVTMPAPHHTITNTAAKITAVLSGCAL